MTPVETVNAHYQVIIDKDVDGICDKYHASADTYVVLEGPRLTTMGYDRIAKGWRDFCNSPLQLRAIDWTEGPYSREVAGMSWVSGIIRLEISHGQRSFENIFRASFVLLQTADGWKISHEHVSLAHPDPYGIGDWLQK